MDAAILETALLRNTKQIYQRSVNNSKEKSPQILLNFRPPQWKAPRDPNSVFAADSKIFKFRLKRKFPKASITSIVSEVKHQQCKCSPKCHECQEEPNELDTGSLTVATIYLIMMILAFSFSSFVAVMIVLKICCLTDCICMECCKANDNRC